MKIVTFIFLLSIVALVSKAQQISYDNYYLVNKFSISPALSGASGNTEALLGIRQNWVGIDGAPEKQTVLLDGPITEGSKAGYGLSFIHERTGNLSHFSGSLAYAYHLELSRESFLSIGITGEVYRNQLEFSEVKGQEDPVLLNQDVYKGTTFNTSFGMAYRYKDRDRELVIGASLPRVLETKIKYVENSEYTLAREFLVHASYFGELSREVDIEPFALVRMTMNSGLLYEANIRFRFMKQVWIAPGYRTGSVLLSAGAALGSRMVMNYSYEYGLNGISASSSGSHEISLCFLVKPPRRQIGPSIFPETEATVSSNKKDNEIKKLKDELKSTQDSTNKKIADLAAQLEALKTNPPVAEKQEQEQDKEEENWQRPMVLKNINFSSGSDRLLSSSFPMLNKLAANMKRNPRMVVRIVGYTDNVGAERINQKLSEKRAQSIADYLIEKRGIEKSRVLVLGLGEKNPIASNDTEQGREKNRRIEAQFKMNKK